MSDKPQASPQPLTPAEIDEWREAAEPGLALHLHRIVLRRFIATIDALNAELHLLREGRRKLLEPDGLYEASDRYAQSVVYPSNEHPLRPIDEYTMRGLRDSSAQDFRAGWAAAQAAFEREK